MEGSFWLRNSSTNSSFSSCRRGTRQTGEQQPALRLGVLELQVAGRGGRDERCRKCVLDFPSPLTSNSLRLVAISASSLSFTNCSQILGICMTMQEMVHCNFRFPKATDSTESPAAPPRSAAAVG